MFGDSVSKRFVFVCIMILIAISCLFFSQAYFEGKIAAIHKKELVLLTLKHRVVSLGELNTDPKGIVKIGSMVSQGGLNNLENDWQAYQQVIKESGFKKDERINLAMTNYRKSSYEASLVVKNIGITKDKGTRIIVRESAHVIEDELYKKGLDKELVLLLQMRRAEKDFLLRRELSYINKFDEHKKSLMASFVERKEQHLVTMLNAYSTRLEQLVELCQVLGLNHEDGVRGEYSKATKELVQSLVAVSTELKERIEGKRKTLRVWQYVSMAVNLSLVMVLITSTFISIRRAVSRFSAFFNESKTSMKKLDESEFGMREFIDMAKMANDMVKSRVDIEEKWHQAINELRAVNKDLEKLSRIDALTELPNRRMLDEQFAIAWKNSVSSGESLAVILLDVDDFKSYNDYYGHDKGDEVLSKVAAALAEVSKAHDGFAARYGGEEFFVMLPGKDEAAAEDIAWELVKSIRELDLMHRRSSNGKFVTISAGLHAGIALQNKAANSWISKADQALYFAKYSGRDQVKIKNK